MTHAHEADDWTGDFTINYDGPKNLVARCPDCGTEKGEHVVTGTTIGPHYSINSQCTECSTWTDHYPIREAERGEYDGDYICSECDQLHSNTLDADLCCGDNADA